MTDMNFFIRENLSKLMKNEDFLLYVAKTIEKQLKEWDSNYEMLVMKLEDYEIMLKNMDKYYHSTVSEWDLFLLQCQSPFALDQKIWKDFFVDGFPIKKEMGKYLEQIFRDGGDVENI